MDPNVAFKNFIVAAILLGIVAFAALMFQPGGLNQGGWSNQGGTWSGGGNWRRGGDDDWGDDD